MDRNFDNSMYGPGFVPYMSSIGMDTNMDPNSCGENMFNPMNQYEQGYMYYKYMCQQLDYKIKCREYEKLCGNSTNNRKVE